MDSARGTGVQPAQTTPARQSRRGCGCLIAVVLVLVIGGALTAFFGATFAFRQKTVQEPEAIAADLAKRYIMVPSEFVDWRMPDEFRNAQSVSDGQQLFQAECALCHGQKARGDAQLGMSQFPPAVDLTRDRTQSKTDGQLFWLISHGINYTGMPGWSTDYGGPNDQREIWSLVSYIRSLKGSK